MSDRLTGKIRNLDGSASSIKPIADDKGFPNKFGSDVLTKLADYEDLEEQSRLIKLPCGVGDTYYQVYLNTKACHKCEYFVSGYEYDMCKNKDIDDHWINPQCIDELLCDNHFYEINEYRFENVDKIFNLRSLFGKSIFLIKEEAEKKLEELNERTY